MLYDALSFRLNFYQTTTDHTCSSEVQTGWLFPLNIPVYQYHEHKVRWDNRFESVCVGSRYLWGVPRIFERKTFNDHLITNDGNVFICRKSCPFMFREQSIRSSRDWRRNENSIMSKNCFVFIDLLSKFHKKAKIKHGLKSNWELEKA